MNGYSIGELSRRTGVKVPTIRFYEVRGLLPEPGRTAGNQRRYGEDGLHRLAFVSRARALGFPMEAIEQLLALDDMPDRPHAEVRDIAQAQLAEVRSRIRELRSLERELGRVVELCDGKGTGPCRILEAIADEGGERRA